MQKNALVSNWFKNFKVISVKKYYKSLKCNITELCFKLNNLIKYEIKRS